MNAARAALLRLFRFSLRERCLIGASVYRVVAGIAILYQYTINYGIRHLLFGPTGVYDYDVFRAQGGFPSLYALGRSPVLFEILYHLGAVVAMLWVVGFRTRWTTPLNYLFWRSLQTRCPFLSNGGDNLQSLVMFYAMFADVGAHLSVDAERRAKTSLARRKTAPWWRGLGAVLHNAAILAVALQMAILYEVSGLTKVQGECWRTGTVIYYSLSTAQFAFPALNPLVYRSAAVCTALATAVVAFQVSFPFLLVMGPRSRAVAVVVSILFHLGIATCMGLISFSTFMIAADLLLVGDREYRALGRFLSRAPAALRRIAARPSRRPRAATA